MILREAGGELDAGGWCGRKRAWGLEGVLPLALHRSRAISRVAVPGGLLEGLPVSLRWRSRAGEIVARLDEALGGRGRVPGGAIGGRMGLSPAAGWRRRGRHHEAGSAGSVAAYGGGRRGLQSGRRIAASVAGGPDRHGNRGWRRGTGRRRAGDGEWRRGQRRHCLRHREGLVQLPRVAVCGVHDGREHGDDLGSRVELRTPDGVSVLAQTVTVFRRAAAASAGQLGRASSAVPRVGGFAEFTTGSYQVAVSGGGFPDTNSRMHRRGNCRSSGT